MPESRGDSLDLEILEINADVPQGFTSNITLNFTRDDGYNLFYVITNISDYRAEIELEPGNYKLDFAQPSNYYENLEYRIIAPEALTVSSETDNFYSITVEKRDLALQEDEAYKTIREVDERQGYIMSEKIIDTPEKDISNGAGLNHSLTWIIPIIAAAYFVFKAVRKIKN